ncbi:MAG: dCMP deaminase family protein [Candidatus ainarchaeum sp.]|nr:dCMP deaminase family protein [Candidatus ainarchaeum sp.]
MIFMQKRISWDEYFMKIAEIASERATCFKRKAGAVLVIDKQIISTGYCGAPKGVQDCFEKGHCMREKKQLKSGQNLEFCMATHAEQNAIAQAACFGIPTKGATIYATHFPCVLCAKLLINAGIKEIVYKNDQFDELSPKILEEAKIIVRKM